VDFRNCFSEMKNQKLCSTFWVRRTERVKMLRVDGRQIIIIIAITEIKL